MIPQPNSPLGVTMELIERVRAGFAGIDADPALKEKALSNLGQWLTGADTVAYRPQLEWQIESSKWSALLDQFYQVLPFGTGGRRGAVGIGPNRMNLWTLGASVQGHCDYLKQRFPSPNKPLTVVLAYDVRQFEDTRKVYNPNLPNPVLHLSSRDFAQYAATIYAANGIHASILPPESSRYLATPELSFSIRYLQAHGGLNVSASHNPPDDNGGKFYDQNGAQPVPPEDQLMSELVESVTTVKSLPWAEAVKSGRVHFLDDAPHRAYIELCRKQSLIAPPRKEEFRLVFTPLHGVGGTSAMEVLAAHGYAPIPVAEQMEPNGQFPNVTQSPNPEVPASLDRAEAVAKAHQADLILATDPDADRIGGLACKSIDGKGAYRFLTGNEIVALLVYFKLDQLAKIGRLPASPVIVKTEVTTSLVTRIARKYNAQVVENLLVGCKYIAEVIRQLEQDGAYEDISGTADDFVLGGEESHGILATPHIRDKDAASAALLLAETALDCKRRGTTVPALLDDLAREFGYFRNEVLNIVMTGIEGKSNMTRMLDSLRSTPPVSIGGLPVVGFEDLRDENGRMGPLKGDTDRASRNVLIFRLGEATAGSGITGKVVLRPSGTEPKAKAYIEVCSAPFVAGTAEETWLSLCSAIDKQAQALATDFLSSALATVGQTPGPGADKLSR